MSNPYLAALDALAYSRPHLDPNNYGPGPYYRADQRANVQALNDYRALRSAYAAFEDDELRTAGFVDAVRGGRISFYTCKDGKTIAANYCAGQYYPVEYRPACARVLARVWWRIQAAYGHDADTIRAHARKVFGPGIARRWFN